MGFTCNTSATDRYVNPRYVSFEPLKNVCLLLIFKLPKKNLRAKVDRFKVVTRNISEILSGYLSVSATSFHRAISFAALSQIWCVQKDRVDVRLDFHFGLRFTESLLALSSRQHTRDSLAMRRASHYTVGKIKGEACLWLWPSKQYKVSLKWEKMEWKIQSLFIYFFTRVFCHKQMPIQYSKTATFQHDILILLRPTFFNKPNPIYQNKNSQKLTLEWMMMKYYMEDK